MDNSNEPSLKEIFESVVEDENVSTFNIEGSLEIAEIMNQSKANCKEGISLMIKSMDSFSTVQVYKTVLVCHPKQAPGKPCEELQYEIPLSRLFERVCEYSQEDPAKCSSNLKSEKK